MPGSEKNDMPSLTPEIIKKMRLSNMDRRSFIIKMALAGTASLVPFAACMKNESQRNLLLQRDPAVLSSKEWDILEVVQNILFPSELTSPGAKEINAAAWVQWVINDNNLDPEERKFLKDGLSWVDEEAMERWEKPFLSMLPENQEKLLRHMESAHSWGESWLSVMLLHIFEALFADPVYGTNPNGKNWVWLNYNAGQPRPKAVYSDQLAMINK